MPPLTKSLTGVALSAESTERCRFWKIEKTGERNGYQWPVKPPKTASIRRAAETIEKAATSCKLGGCGVTKKPSRELSLTALV